MATLRHKEFLTMLEVDVALFAVDSELCWGLIFVPGIGVPPVSWMLILVLEGLLLLSLSQEFFESLLLELGKELLCLQLLF